MLRPTIQEHIWLLWVFTSHMPLPAVGIREWMPSQWRGICPGLQTSCTKLLLAGVFGLHLAVVGDLHPDGLYWQSRMWFPLLTQAPRGYGEGDHGTLLFPGSLLQEVSTKGSELCTIPNGESGPTGHRSPVDHQLV